MNGPSSANAPLLNSLFQPEERIKTMLDNAAIRAASWSRVSEFGGAKNPELPLLDFPEFRLRKLAEVESRCWRSFQSPW